MLLGLLTAAWAHRPHTPVTAFAVDPDVLSSGEAWLVMESNDASQVMRSSDGGRHWDAVHTPARVDRFVGGGWGAEGPVLLAADGTLWSADATGAWASFEVGADAWALAIGPDELAVATLDGVWRAPLDDLAAGALAPTVRAARDVAWSPDGELWFLDANGGVARIGDTEARDLGATALSATADGLLAATADGVVWRDGTSWRPCGALPDGGEGDYANTPAFVGAADGGATALAATGQALYRSTDRCASWTLLPALDEVEYGTLGAAGDPSEAVIAAWVDGEHALVAGFNGVASSEAAADSFDHAVLLPEAFCRGVAFDPDYPAIPRLWVGCYGGGTRYSDDGGATWSGAGWGLTGPFVYGLAVTSAPVVPATSSSHVVHTTEDGYTWRQVEPAPLPEVSGLQASGPRLIALGTNTELEGDVRVSDDQGRSWRAIPAIEGRGGHPSWVHHAEIGGAPTIAIAYDVPAELFLSTDGGTTGRVVDAGGAVERAAGAVSWPPDSGLRWVWATAGLGVRISDDGAATWGGAPPPPPPPPPKPPHPPPRPPWGGNPPARRTSCAAPTTARCGCPTSAARCTEATTAPRPGGRSARRCRR